MPSVIGCLPLGTVGEYNGPCSRGFRGLSHARQNHGRHHRCPRAKSHRTIWALRRRSATGQGRAQLVSGPVWRGGPCVGRACGPHHRMGGVPAVCPPVPARAQRPSMQAKRSQALVQVALRRRRIVCLVIVWPIERVVSFARVGWSRNFTCRQLNGVVSPRMIQIVTRVLGFGSLPRAR